MIDYDPHHWSEHLFDLEGTMVREIGTRVASDTIWAGIVVLLYYANVPVSFPATGHTLVGLALGLLLVFRTNASYDRFWEGRKLWGGIVNETRNLARQAVVHFRADPALASQVVRWTSALAWAIRHTMHNRAEIGPIADQLPVDEVQATCAAQHIPLAIAVKLTELLAEGRRRGLVEHNIQVSMEQNVQLLVDYLGACERIKNTPLPFAYVVHLRRALILYSISLPLVLVKDFGWGTVPATFCVAYTFFGIEEIGVEIENPFGDDANDLPLDRICENIQKNLEALDKGLGGPATTS